MHHAAVRVATFEHRHSQGIADQLRRHALEHGPAQHRARVQAHHHRQIQPALVGADISDVTPPILIRQPSSEVRIQQSLAPPADCSSIS